MQHSAAIDRWRNPLVLVLVSLVCFTWIHRETAASLVELWQSSETYAHGFIIFPISLYLIWNDRVRLSAITPRPSATALFVLAALSLCWMIARSADVQVVSQYMFVAMISALIASLLGKQLARAIAFPLAFTLLSVPFGEIFIRPLIDFTADFTVTALHLSGIPVYREGSHFALPSGNWSVVEACSGLRYLLASFTLGCLYAHLTFRSRLRQALFIILSIIVPVIANGIRAYLIVLIGHLSSMKLATGIDHLIYGWLFFGFVMMLLFWIGGRWREDDTEPVRTAAIADTAAPPRTALFIAAAALAIAWAAPLVLHHLTQYNPQQATLTLPKTLDGWTAQSSVTGLKPVFPGAAATLLQEYRKGDQRVGIYLAFFRDQGRHAKAVTSQNLLADEQLHEWSLTRESEYRVQGEPGLVRQSQLARGNQLMLAWQYYLIDGVQTGNPYLAKYLQAKQRLTGRGDDCLDIVIFAPYDKHPEEVAAMMADFVRLAPQAIGLHEETGK